MDLIETVERGNSHIVFDKDAFYGWECMRPCKCGALLQTNGKDFHCLVCGYTEQRQRNSISQKQSEEIFKLYQQGKSSEELAKMFGVTRNQISGQILAHRQRLLRNAK